MIVQVPQSTFDDSYLESIVRMTEWKTQKESTYLKKTYSRNGILYSFTFDGRCVLGESYIQKYNLTVALPVETFWDRFTGEVTLVKKDLRQMDIMEWDIKTSFDDKINFAQGIGIYEYSSEESVVPMRGKIRDIAYYNTKILVTFSAQVPIGTYFYPNEIISITPQCDYDLFYSCSLNYKLYKEYFKRIDYQDCFFKADLNGATLLKNRPPSSIRKYKIWKLTVCIAYDKKLKYVLQNICDDLGEKTVKTTRQRKNSIWKKSTCLGASMTLAIDIQENISHNFCRQKEKNLTLLLTEFTLQDENIILHAVCVTPENYNIKCCLQRRIQFWVYRKNDDTFIDDIHTWYNTTSDKQKLESAMYSVSELFYLRQLKHIGIGNIPQSVFPYYNLTGNLPISPTDQLNFLNSLSCRLMTANSFDYPISIVHKETNVISSAFIYYNLYFFWMRKLCGNGMHKGKFLILIYNYLLKIRN